MDNTHILVAALKIVHKGIAEGTVVLDDAARTAVEEALGLPVVTTPANQDAVQKLTDALSGPFRDDPAAGARAFTAVLPLLQSKADEVSMPLAEYQWRERERIGLLRLKRLLSDFDITVEHNRLVSPMTYLEEVQLTREFQPGIGSKVADAIRDAVSPVSVVGQSACNRNNLGQQAIAG